jgi:hypothetical protein
VTVFDYGKVRRVHPRWTGPIHQNSPDAEDLLAPGLPAILHEPAWRVLEPMRSHVYAQSSRGIKFREVEVQCVG